MNDVAEGVAALFALVGGAVVCVLGAILYCAVYALPLYIGFWALTKVFGH